MADPAVAALVAQLDADDWQARDAAAGGGVIATDEYWANTRTTDVPFEFHDLPLPPR